MHTVFGVLTGAGELLVFAVAAAMLLAAATMAL